MMLKDIKYLKEANIISPYFDEIEELMQIKSKDLENNSEKYIIHSSISDEHKITQSEYKTTITSREYVIVYFYTDWSGIHWLMKLQFESAKKKIQNVLFVQYNVDKFFNVFELGIIIKSIPTLAIFQNGKLIDSHGGLLQENDIIQFVQENINKAKN